MKYLIFLISVFVSSCCLFTSRDCSCYPPDPFINEETIYWHEPFESANVSFSSTGFSDLSILKEYKSSEECVGGDECCSTFPTHVTTWYQGEMQDESMLFSVKSLGDEIIFYGDVVPDMSLFTWSFIGKFNVLSNANSITPDFELLVTDTTVNNYLTKSVVIKNLQSPKSKIQRLVFIKGLGVVAFTDLDNKTWRVN